LESQIAKFKAEAAAYTAEAEYNLLQSERLMRVRDEEDASTDHNRILDFVVDVTDQSVYRSLQKLSEWRAKSLAPITIRFNTGGGDLISGMALYDYIIMLRNEDVVVNTIALGMVASMGGILFQAGTNRYMSPGAWLMIHELSTFNEGKLSEVKDYTKWLERAQVKMEKILASRSTLSLASIKRRTAKGKDWWLDAEEAVKYGFADSIAFTAGTPLPGV